MPFLRLIFLRTTKASLTNSNRHRSAFFPIEFNSLCESTILALFRCLEFMPDYINCLLQGYGVLPGPPSKVHVTNVAPYFAILHWSSPTTLGDTVQYYNLHYRKITSDDNQYSIIQKVLALLFLRNSPFITSADISDSSAVRSAESRFEYWI